MTPLDFEIPPWKEDAPQGHSLKLREMFAHSHWFGCHLHIGWERGSKKPVSKHGAKGPLDMKALQFPLQRCHLLTKSLSLFLPFSSLFLQGNFSRGVLEFCIPPICSGEGEGEKQSKGKLMCILQTQQHCLLCLPVLARP
ncbi:uncharacterized protein M8220_010121 isoform 1-T1 [Acridotheres tristis]